MNTQEYDPIRRPLEMTLEPKRVPVHGVGSPAWLFTDPSEVGKLFFEIGIEGMDQLGESG